MDKYEDIINMEHHVSKNHMPMSIESRAAQFAPFAALSGYDKAIDHTGETTVYQPLFYESVDQDC